MITTELLTLAKKVNNYEADATGGTLWESTTSYKATVPTGKRWFVIGGHIKRDNSSTVTTQAYDAAGKIIAFLDDQGAAATTTSWLLGNYFPLDAGEWVRMIFGTAQGSSATASCCVLEVDV